MDANSADPLAASVKPERGEPPVLALIDKIAADCGTKDWDSYRADPVTAEAADAARILVRSLYAVPTIRGGISLFFANEGITATLGPDGGLVEFYADVNETADYVAAVRAARPVPSTTGDPK